MLARMRSARAKAQRFFPLCVRALLHVRLRGRKRDSYRRCRWRWRGCVVRGRKRNAPHLGTSSGGMRRSGAKSQCLPLLCVRALLHIRLRGRETQLMPPLALLLARMRRARAKARLMPLLPLALLLARMRRGWAKRDLCPRCAPGYCYMAACAGESATHTAVGVAVGADAARVGETQPMQPLALARMRRGRARMHSQRLLVNRERPKTRRGRARMRSRRLLVNRERPKTRRGRGRKLCQGLGWVRRWRRPGERGMRACESATRDGSIQKLTCIVSSLLLYLCYLRYADEGMPMRLIIGETAKWF